MSSVPAWTRTNNNLVEWDDGFHPSASASAGKIVLNQPKTTPGLFRIIENAVPDSLADSLYASAVAAKLWGVYIPTLDVKNNNLQAYPASKDEAERHTLALLAIRAFLYDSNAISTADWEDTHGVVVWVITSSVNDTVNYHMDYAEMFRYQTNITYPPKYGATLHVSPLNTSATTIMKGGDFYANSKGLAHYKEHGYKEAFAPLPSQEQMEKDKSYLIAPYKYKRGVIMDGNFPHGSFPVTELPQNTHRVVVGFNLFNWEIGPHAQEYPEHSSKFNKYVKVAQAACKKEPLTLEAIKKSPQQAAFLRYLLRKAKEKNLIQNNQFVA
ncbi:hypothetical protein THRCLA_08046 [Thraustotheca clavata]|uniref:Uncharacterized protein n=1 Tax=Thraustotheca clavata TaxID=74557 RepID=A0A1V9ZAG7_9STRA|nr:hypothetical protein THRCLA_08046 [Thraustotheca clavata]